MECHSLVTSLSAQVSAVVVALGSSIGLDAIDTTRQKPGDYTQKTTEHGSCKVGAQNVSRFVDGFSLTPLRSVDH